MRTAATIVTKGARKSTRIVKCGQKRLAEMKKLARRQGRRRARNFLRSGKWDYHHPVVVDGRDIS